MSDRRRPTGLVYALGALCAGAIVAAFLVVGPTSGSATASSRVVTAQRGIVQSTVSGSGNIQAATQLNLGFKTSGVVQRIYVTEGEHVTSGQLVAELNPASAEASLEQAKATLQGAEASLVALEENEGESTSGGGSSAKTASFGASASTIDAAYEPGSGAAPATGTPAATTPEQTTPAAETPSATTPSTTTTTTTTAPATGGTTHTSGSTGSGSSGRSGQTSSGSSGTTTGSSGTASGSGETSKSSTEKTKQSLATREANLASARATVKSDKLAVQSAEEALSDTKLLAPQSGTIVSLTGEVGETVSGGGTSKSSTSSSSSSSSASSAAGAGAGSGRGATGTGSGGSSTSSSSNSSSSSGFAVLSDLSTMQLVVPLSESEIVHVHVDQPATVAIEALEGVKLAAEVVNVATLSTSNSGVVSYDVTFQLNQSSAQVRPGMSATAEVVVKQEEGVNVPTSAITADTVTIVRNGQDVRQRVVTGLAGNSSTIVLRGLNAGEQVRLPITSSSSSTSVLSRIGSRLGGGTGSGAIGGTALGGGGGGAAFFRGAP